MDVTRRSFLVGATAVGSLAFAPSAGAGSRSRTVPDPVGSLVTRWDSDPWSLGSYSALPTGVPAAVRGTIARALVGSRIAVAGEFVDWAHPATVPGALRSGRAAARLLDGRGGAVSGRRVVVVGAGMAGLGAATELKRRGADVVVLEARSRVGGRIHTDRSLGVPVELGASWLHGVRGNVMVPLVRRAGLGQVRTDYENESVRSTDSGGLDRRAQSRARTLAALAYQLSESSPPVSMSVARWLAEHRWVSDGPDDWAVNTEIVQEYGLDPELLGTHALTEGAYQRGGDDFVTGGYDRVPRMLAGDLDVRTSSPVGAVAAQGSQVVVTMMDGRTERADLAVVAVPLALLQAGRPALSPLSPDVSSAISRLTTGSLQKVVLAFDSDWWRRDFATSAEVIGVVGGRWSEWYDMTRVTGRPTLVGFCGGGAADRRPGSAEACVAEAMRDLRSAFLGT